MEKNRKILFGKFAAILCVVPVLLLAHSGGPAPRSVSAPGDPANGCAQAGCHTGTAVNSATGSVSLTFPNGLTYTPGAKQRIKVKVTDSSATTRVYGFQASARLVSNEARGMAGTFTSLGAGIFVQCEDGGNKPATGCRASVPLEFIQHEFPSNTGEWEFDWTPPATNVGNVHLYVAGNAANNNGQNTGDKIFLANYILTPGAAVVKPTISGVVNGASFASGIVSGSWVTLNGKFNTASNRVWKTTGPESEIVNGVLPKSLDGISVKINNKDASIYYISDSQLNIQAPSDTALGPVAVTVTSGGVTSDSFTGNLVSEQPGFFMFPSNYVAAVLSDGAFIAKAGLFGASLITIPAKPLDVLLLFGTGFGATSPAVPAGSVYSSAAPLVGRVTVRIANIDCPVAFGGLTGAGLYQFNITVPATVPNGDQPIEASINGQKTQSSALITILR